MRKYGDMRDYKKVELFINGKYAYTTTWARNLKMAKEMFLKSDYGKYLNPSWVTARYYHA